MSKYKNPVPSVDDIAEVKQDVEERNDYDYNKKIFFAFIDVLGFKKVFDDNREGDKVNDVEFASKFREVFIYYFELMNASHLLEKTGCYAGQTSDSLYFYSPREDWLMEYIKIFLHFNLFAMSKDVFFRGGVAEGNLFIKNPYQFYGESVIYSYLLESVISKYPIVVIDEDTYRAIENFPDTKYMVSKKNGRYYLNILAPLKKGFSLDLKNGEFELKKFDVKQILENIKRNKRKFEYDAQNYAKYDFLLKEFARLQENENNTYISE